MPTGLWQFLHLVFAVSFATAVIGAHWNALLIRRTPDWNRRVALLEANHRNTLVFGLASLLLLGVLGNLSAISLGYRMAADHWLRWSNGLWLLTLLLLLAVEIPAAARVLAEARRGADAGAAPAYDRALARWRASNGIMLLIVVGFLALMVFHWRS
jgi:uncharacterized membrane protein